MPHFRSLFGRVERARSLVWVPLLLVITAVAWGAPPTEYRVKAVFLFNFAQFVEWPPANFPAPDTPFVIGVLGSDPFGAQLDDVVRGETVDRHPMQIKRYRTVGELGDCNILYIARSEMPALPQILANLKGHSVLTVSDAEGADQRGVMIQLVTERSHVRMRIDVGAAKAGNLTISSKLLRPAEIVTTGER